jgi:hypothetical protein
MFRVPFLVAVILAVAFGGGIWLTRIALDATVGFGAIRLGSWEAFPDAQNIHAGPYAKTHRAENGLLLLGSSEGLSFSAKVDDSGKALDPACTYVISGLTPPARFWSLYAASTASLPLNPGEGLPGSLNSWTVLRKMDGSFDVTVSSKAAPGNWLALRGRQPFKLVLSLFDTPTAGSSGLVDLSMPKVIKAGCGNA